MNEEMKTAKTIIAKVTHDCNLRCKYCSVGDVPEKGRMSVETLSNLIRKTASENEEGETSIIWHGGEPLLVGLGFYKKVIELQNDIPGHRFNNSVQTNGTLLNNEWLDFFKANNFGVGLSLDGCKETHDSNRPYKNGLSSFESTLHWIEESKKRGMGGGAICVLNKNTVSKLREIYDFSKKKKISFKFNPQYPSGRAIQNNDWGLTSDELASAYIQLFDLWHNDSVEERAKIDFFESISDGITAISLGKAQNVRPYDCGFKNQCQHSYLAVSPNGNIYPCGKFVGEDTFLYGNINEAGRLSEKLKNPVRNRFIERHDGLTECVDCRYKPLCNSGCANLAFLFHNDIMRKNPYCESYKKLYAHIEKVLVEEGKEKDIYLLPSSKEDQFIVYSPLRRVSFFVDADAAKLVKDYLENGVKIPQECTKLHDHFRRMNEMVVREPNKRVIGTRDDVVILLSQKCNLACSYCYAQSARSQDMLSQDMIKTVVDHVLSTSSHRRHKTFSFMGGGEPTVTWDLFTWAVNYINSVKNGAKVRISLTTNGTLLNEERILWMKENGVHAGVSFDILPQVQHTQRPFPNMKNSFDIVDRNIKSLLSHGFSFSLRSTITSDSIDAMPDMVRHVHEHYPSINRIILEPVTDVAQNNDAFYSRYIECFFKARDIGNSMGIEINNSFTKSLSSVHTRYCGGEFCVTPKGELVACHRVSSKEDPLFETMRYGTIEDRLVIDNDRLQIVEHLLDAKQGTCHSCFAKWNCSGLCLNNRTLLSGEQLRHYCNFGKAMILRTVEEYLNQNNV